MGLTCRPPSLASDVPGSRPHSFRPGRHDLVAEHLGRGMVAKVVRHGARKSFACSGTWSATAACSGRARAGAVAGGSARANPGGRELVTRRDLPSRESHTFVAVGDELATFLMPVAQRPAAAAPA